MLTTIVLALTLGAAHAAAPPTPAAAHDIHSSVTEIVYDARAASAAVTVRVFADDLEAALGPSVPLAEVGDTRSRAASSVLAYLASSLQIADHRGRPLALEWVGASRAAAVLTVSLRARAPGGLYALAVRNTILVDRFKDQINIVRAALRGRRSTALFTRGDGEKRLH